jgi:hypothetical protein
MKTLHLDLADVGVPSRFEVSWLFFLEDALEERYVLLEGRTVLLGQLLHA